MTLIAVVPRPGLDDAATQGRALEAGTDVADLNGLPFPPIVSTSLLLVATVLAVYKPWGAVARRATPARL